MTPSSYIEINLDSIKAGLRLCIDAREHNTLFDAEGSAVENIEARYQLIEGFYYDFTFSDLDFTLENEGQEIVQSHSRNRSFGTISPNIYVGTLSIPVIQLSTNERKGAVKLEVQSVKYGYRDDYRDMLEYITEMCSGLLLHANTPVSHYFDIDYTQNSQTLYQKFAFIQSVIGTDEFSESIHRIVTAPVTQWTEKNDQNDIRQTRRFSNAQAKEMVKGVNRTTVPDSHYLRKYGLTTLPHRIQSVYKTDSVDTPENRFVKHALETFLKFCMDINNLSAKKSKLDIESNALIRKLESQFHHSVFKKVSRPITLKLNSPVLQRKEGYREILRVWLMFDLAAKLIWTGGDDVYSGGKKDIATLYEYWLFFKLLNLFEDLFDIKSEEIADLIQETPDGLNLTIKQGKFTPLKGIFHSDTRKLNVRYCYNRTFSGKKSYPKSGSWTTTLRPDYTLTFWPYGISESEAEIQELIVHIHFDAKYKVDKLVDLVSSTTEDKLNEEKTENRKGIYKNADLLKMHAYKDAIRRTGGAYVLYPGDQSVQLNGFHEIIPGLGAFPVRPSKMDTGIGELKGFILEIIDHFINRASQREKIAFRTFDIFRDPPEPGQEVNELLPESYNDNRGLLPDDTFVLIGFYRSEEKFNWIKKNKLYNFRMGSGKGSLPIDTKTLNAQFLLLHTTGDSKSGDLWQITSRGLKIYSRQDMIRKGYPSPTQDHYLILQIEPVTAPEFKNVQWDFKQLPSYRTRRASAIPFTVSLTELMKSKTH